MTAASFALDMTTGGGKYAAVAFISGCPWAVTTSTELVSALSDPGGGTDAQKKARAYRQLLFGQTDVTTHGHYPSDHVVIIPSLDENLGKQTISYDESKGITGGAWSFKFGRDAHGATYTHFRSGAVAGTYDFLDVMPDPIYDSSVKTGILAEDWRGDAGSTWLTWGNDTGLYDAVVINHAAGLPYYVWVGSSCLALSSPADNWDGTFKAVADPGCLRTVREPIMVPHDDAGAHMITSAQVSSIVGMPAVLYFIPMTEDGAIAGLPTAGDFTVLANYTKPVIVREGPVKPNPTCNPEGWEVDCGFALDFLNTDIAIDTFDGEIRGYRLHRPPDVADHAVRPHLQIHEWDGAAYVETEIWLCDEDSAVNYPTKTELFEALKAELQDRDHSDAEVNNYHLPSYGNMYSTSPDAGQPTYINGPCAWILRLGYSKLEDFRGSGLGALRTPRWEVFFDGDLFDAVDEKLGFLRLEDSLNSLGDWTNKPPGGMAYYYQWNWKSDYHCEMLLNSSGNLTATNLNNNALVNHYPVPYYITAGPFYRISCKHESDVTTLYDGQHFSLGNTHTRHQLRGEVQETSSNYIKVDGTVDHEGPDNVTFMDVVVGSSSGLDPDYNLSMRWGQPLYYWPAIHDPEDDGNRTGGDGFRITQIVENGTSGTETLSDLFRGLLGAPSTQAVAFPRRSVLHHVPNVWTDTTAGPDWRVLVDWDRLDQLVASIVPGAQFVVQFTERQNVLKLLLHVLLDLGIRPTWGYREVHRAWVLGFEPLGAVNPAAAMVSGRVFDKSNTSPTPPRGLYGNTWLYHNVRSKFNYQGNKPAINLLMTNITGRAMLASGNKTLEIEDRLLQISSASDAEDHINNLRGIMGRMNSAQPSVSLVCKLNAWPLTVVAGDCLITSDLIYDLYAGSRGITRRAAMLTKVSTDIQFNRTSESGGKFNINCEARIAANAKAIGPSLQLEAANMSLAGSIVTVTGLATDPANNDYQNPLNSPNGLTDLAYFGCIDYDPATDTRSVRNCSCDQYAVVLVEKNQTAWDIAGAGRNMFTGRLLGSATDTLTLADISNGAARITIDADAAEFDDTSTYIVYFCDWDDEDIQGCQEVYGWLGDEDGLIMAWSAAKSQAMTWS